MVNAQEYINQKYPTKEEKEKVIVLDIRRQNLEGKLDLSEFINLEILNCSENKLTALDLSGLIQLEQIICRDNYLTNINYPVVNSEKLVYLSIRNNNLQKQDLSKIDKFINLKELWIGSDDKEKIEKEIYNRFFGSLGGLKNMSELEVLYINNTDLNSGLEYLPDNISKIYYSAEERPESKVKEIARQLDLFVSKKQSRWERLGFNNYKEIKPWIEVGLTFSDCYLADYLKNEKALSPSEVEGKLSKLKKEYDLIWKVIHSGFTPELQEEWEKREFKYNQVREWINFGLKPEDADYARWLTDIKKIVVRTALNYSNDQTLRKEYKYYSQLSTEVIKQIKYLPVYPNLTLEQELLIEQSIPNEELRKRYKKWGLCRECQQPNTNRDWHSGWCKSCSHQDFQKITIDNREIAEFIRKQQLEATEEEKTLVWIPYEKFTNIEHLADGGFGKIFKAKWNKDKSCFRWVALKSLNGSQNRTAEFLTEITNYKLFAKSGRNFDIFDGYIVNCYGISQDPRSKNYVMVMQYVNGGNLREYLQNNIRRLKFRDKLKKLVDIANGLNLIHVQGLVHRDLHAGNVLNTKEDGNGFLVPNHYHCRITDLGLAKPVNETDDGKIYGVIPYVAPEVLQGKPYTKASDIYSFGIIAYELLSGLPPYYDKPHGLGLQLKICEGLRPQFQIKIPQLLEDLIKQCWDAEPDQRPITEELYEVVSGWWSEIRGKKDTEFAQQVQLAETYNQTLPKEIRFPQYQIHPRAIYTSRLIDTKVITQSLSTLKVAEQCWGSKDIDLDINDLNLKDKEIKQTSQIEIPPKSGN